MEPDRRGAAELHLHGGIVDFLLTLVNPHRLFGTFLTLSFTLCTVLVTFERRGLFLGQLLDQRRTGCCGSSMP